jgi:hypothetical protein
LGNFGYKEKSEFDVREPSLPGPGNYLKEFFGEPVDKTFKSYKYFS